MIKHLLLILTQWSKSKLSLFILVLLLPIYSNGQICFETKHKWDADILVYITPTKSQATYLKHYSSQKSSLSANVVYWTKYKWEAEYKVFFVKYKWQADEIWYITRYKWQVSDGHKKWIGGNGVEFYD